MPIVFAKTDTKSDRLVDLDVKPACFFYYRDPSLADQDDASAIEKLKGAFEAYVAPPNPNAQIPKDAKDARIAARPKDWPALLNATQGSGAARGLLLQASDDPQAVCEIFAQEACAFALVYVADFKDGRAFSHTRRLRQAHPSKPIWIAGDFGVDQATYFVRSGASGFVGDEKTRAALAKTLLDLPSASFAYAAAALPLFAQ